MSDYGVVTEAGTIRFERVLPGPIERVWGYLTDSEKRGTWLATGNMELRPGGKVELNFHHADLSSEKEPPAKYEKMKGGVQTTGRIVRVEKPRLLVFMWAGDEGETEVTFELTPRGKDVLLVLTHRLLDRATMLGVLPGWHAHLAILEDRLAGAEPRPFWTTHGNLEKEYAARV
jgi:uncharacterized protein YndB with AHSA1/START domain